MLPQLDQTPLFNCLNLNISALDANDPGPNSTAFRVHLSVLACPSDPHARAPFSNYAGCMGDHHSGFKPNGVFFWKPTRLAAIPDGTSGTAALSEQLVAWPERVERLRTHFAPLDFMGPPATLDQFQARCEGLIDMRPAMNLRGYTWTLGQREATLYDHALPINRPTCDNTQGSTEVVTSTTATSLHPGGAHCLFVDGHVVFQSEQIAPAVWRALGTRNGNEVVSVGDE
jgi:prepilin-type processing-associated H-X9-DG protein